MILDGTRRCAPNVMRWVPPLPPTWPPPAEEQPHIAAGSSVLRLHSGHVSFQKLSNFQDMLSVYRVCMISISTSSESVRTLSTIL